jgi:hypothetical protein
MLGHELPRVLLLPGLAISVSVGKRGSMEIGSRIMKSAFAGGRTTHRPRHLSLCAVDPGDRGGDRGDPFVRPSPPQ